MNDATLKFVLDKREKFHAGYSVKLRFTYMRRISLFRTNVFLENDDELKRVTDFLSTPKASKLKDDQYKLEKIWNRAKKELRYLEEREEVSNENFKMRFGTTPTKRQNAFAAFETLIAELKEQNRTGTAISYQNALDSLKAFHERESIKFNQITPKWLNRYEAWMISKGRTETTVGIYLRALRAIINKAIDDGHFERDLYPFGKRRYTIPSGRNPKKALSIPELKKFMDEPTLNGTMEEKARDMFLFSMFCNGANMNDVFSLRWRNITSESIFFVREKTKRTSKGNRKIIEVPITPPIGRILDKWANKDRKDDEYIFPFLDGSESSERKVSKVKNHICNINKALKNIAERANISKQLSTVVARHTFATILKNSGAPVQFISESLGHSNTTTTQNYLASFEKEQKRKFAEDILKQVFD